MNNLIDDFDVIFLSEVSYLVLCKAMKIIKTYVDKYGNDILSVTMNKRESGYLMIVAFMWKDVIQMEGCIIDA